MLIKKVAIITVNYNGLADTLSLLDSLKKAKKAKSLIIQTIVVDNASHDDSVSVLTKKFPEIDLIANRKNLGFAGGNNTGIKKAIDRKADWLVLINNDCLVDNDFFVNLEKSAINKSQTGALGGLIYFAPGFEFQKHYSKSDSGKVIWYAGGQFDWLNILGSHRHVDEVDTGNLVTEKTDFISGALMIIRTDVLKKVGLFDEKYFMYFEDVDLCQRIKLAGLDLMFDPNIKIWHKVAQSSGIGSPLNDYFITRNRLIFGFKYARLRTKIALIREAVKKYRIGTKAEKIAIKDFFTNHLYQGTWQK